MHIKGLTAISMLAAMGVLAGCGDAGEPTATDDSAYRDTGDQAPAPQSTVPGTEPTEDLAGTDRTAIDRTGQIGQTTQPGTEPSATQPGSTGSGMAMTEFAALDTDSDGKLAENEWQPEVLDGMEFGEIDEDSSGDIDQQEFRQALVSSGTDQLDQSEIEPRTDTTDPTNQ